LCGAEAGNAFFCTPCRRELPRASPGCVRCCEAPPPWSRACIPYAYAWPLDRLVIGMKFGRRLSWARALGLLLADHLPGGCAELVLPVPLHPARLASRGFNQAQEIAAAVAQRHALPLLTHGARRLRATPAQSSLSAAARAENLDGAFSVSTRHVTGRGVLLVDDVVTTGATAAAMARAILQAGAREVSLAAVARA
jgi:ComF family protein